jgi:SagB-type dehydrogenase family enzyme
MFNKIMKQFLLNKFAKFIFIIIVLFTIIFIDSACNVLPEEYEEKEKTEIAEAEEVIYLPEPKTVGEMSLEETIKKRRSVRSFYDKELNLEQISQILWAAQGITDEKGYRSAPSAGALYPLEVYVVKKDGVFHYIPDGHKMEIILEGDIRKKLKEICLGQQWVEDAPVDIIITGIYKRTTIKYGDRGIRYVYLEAGTACQNILLQAVSLGLGAVPVGAFRDNQIQEILNLSKEETPLFVIPIGYKK